MSDENVTVSEHSTVTRDPVTGEAHHITERVVERTDNSNWGLWVAGLAVFGAVLVIALFLIGRSNAPTSDDQIVAAQAEADAARLQAQQAVQDANNARLAAATAPVVLDNGNQAASDAAARSAAAAEAAADRASAAAADAVQVPPPAEPASSGGPDVSPPGQ